MRVSIFKEILKVYSCVLSFIILALLLKPGSIFYEIEVYINYFKSMLIDRDFNIINQIPQSMGWLVTKTFFYPSAHPESQTSAQLPAYAIEYISRVLSFEQQDYYFQFQLATLAINIFCLLLGWVFLQKSADELNLKFQKIDFLLFYFGCPLLYFSLLQTTVIEVFAFPLICYLIFISILFKNNKSADSPLIVGFAAGFLIISKVTFWPVCFIVAGLAIARFFKTDKQVKNILLLFVGMLLPIACNYANRIVKFGYLTNPEVAAYNFFDFSLETVLPNLLNGFFLKGGLFYSSPVYFLSSIGVFLLVRKLQLLKKISYFDTVMLLGWFFLIFFNQIFIIGYITEDHLPGRIHLAFAPMLILGFSYLRATMNQLNKRVADVALVICCLWHIFMTLIYIGIVHIQPQAYLYTTNILPNMDLLTTGLTRYFTTIGSNYKNLQPHIMQTLIFSFLISIIILVNKSRYAGFVAKATIIFCALSFLTMSSLNVIYNQRNIDQLKSLNFYDSKAIGDGAEFFIIDYLLDFAAYIKSRNDVKINAKIDETIKKVYFKVKNQTIKSTPELDRAIETNAPDFSFIIQEQFHRR